MKKSRGRGVARAKKESVLTMNLWCLNPSVAFSMLSETRSIILTSGKVQHRCLVLSLVQEPCLRWTALRVSSVLRFPIVWKRTTSSQSHRCHSDEILFLTNLRSGHNRSAEARAVKSWSPLLKIQTHFNLRWDLIGCLTCS